MLKRRIKNPTGLFFVLSAVLSSGVGLAEDSAKKIVLEFQGGSRKLIYNCDAFRHQVKQGEDFRVLMQYMPSTMKGLVKDNDFITADALDVAFDRNDVRRIEKIIVEYRCSLK